MMNHLPKIITMKFDFENAQIEAYIRQYSHYKKKEEISEFVDSRYQNNESGFLNMKPAFFHELIAEGIKHFSTVKE